MLDALAIGLMPYKDFNIIQGPLVPSICAIFLKIFGQEMIVTRFLAIILDSAILILAYIIMDKLEIKDYCKYFILLILFIIMQTYFTLDYNWATLLLVLIITCIEINKNASWKKELYLGILAGVAFTIKQSTGIIIILAVLGWKILEVRNIAEFKEYIKILFMRILGMFIVLSMFFLILIKIKAFSDYIDYCILGIKTFTNKISYFDRLIKNSDILFKILSISPLFIYIILGYEYIKTNKKEFLILFTYGIAEMSVVYPISDESHFVLGIVPTLISIGYLLNILTKKINEKVEKSLYIFLNAMICVFCISYLIYGIDAYKSQNTNMKLEHFKYLPMDKESILDIQQIEDFIVSNDRKVYILDATSALYMIPINRYNKDFDLFMKGNLGSKGEDGQIERIKKEENKLILIKNKKYKRNWQNPEKVRDFIVNNMNKVGEIGVFDIYE